MKCAGQVELDKYCREVLRKRLPNVPQHKDVRTFTREVWEKWGTIDLLCGGYPCQSFSLAGKRRGRRDPRYLWPSFRRCIREIRPRITLLENVPGHVSLGFKEVLGELAEMGFDAEWAVFPASAFGAWHKRDRLFCVAWDPNRIRCKDGPIFRVQERTEANAGRSSDVAYANEQQYEGCSHENSRQAAKNLSTDAEGNLRRASRDEGPEAFDGSSAAIANPKSERCGQGWPRRSSGGGAGVQDTEGTLADTSSGRREYGDIWSVEPDVGRVAYGVPARVDRLRALGNAIVPQCAEYVGRCVMKAFFEESEEVKTCRT